MEYIFLILAILAFVMIANKLRIAYPIVLVIGGLLLSFFSVFSNVRIDPEMIFFIFLPPLLYEAAWQISWKEFWKWRRAIASFAFPIVIVTSCVIAYVSSALIPGFTLALGFLLGGIISPPDAISASNIMRKVKAPKTLISIAEGESLLNDASSLIVFRFALIAVITGQFHLKEAAASFVLVVLMGVVIGLLIGLIFYAIHRWLPVTTSIEVVLTFIGPYCMYYFAEYFHFSGVLSVVSGGLLLSNMRQSMLTYKSRIHGLNVWKSTVFVLNGLIFILIGLQMPAITQQLGNISLLKAIGYGLAVSLVLIITRLLCTLGASLFTTFISRFISVAEPNPGWKMPFIFGWAGMRGVVSLAAALSIPLLLSDGQQFPFRNLILFITFIVILMTLVVQGLTLPWLIRKLNVQESPNALSEHEQEKIIQKKIAHHTLQYLEKKYDQIWHENDHVNNLREKLKTELKFFNDEILEDSSKENPQKKYQTIYLDMLEYQRNLLGEINRRSEFDEDLIRKYLALIDIEEFKIRERLLEDPLANES